MSNRNMENITTIREAVWNQFGASIDMLENAISICPDELWMSEADFWYKSFHCIFWTDYYLTIDPETFQPPAPYTLSEFDPTGRKPHVAYSKEELIVYINHCRHKAYQLIDELTSEQVNSRWVNGFKNFSLLEILIYNLRHIQHHAGQLNLLLRQKTNKAPVWVSQAKTF